MEKKEEERRSRKASAQVDGVKEEAVSEFNKQMLFIYDASEIEYRR